MIKGRGMIKGRHLALYQIFKTSVFTTKYMINIDSPPVARGLRYFPTQES
jgi:hypothetical protein